MLKNDTFIFEYNTSISWLIFKNNFYIMKVYLFTTCSYEKCATLFLTITMVILNIF